MSDGEMKDIFDRAFKLPPDERARLAHALMSSLPIKPRGNRAVELIGLLAQGAQVPSDNEITQIVDEHRMGKYGQ